MYKRMLLATVFILMFCRNAMAAVSIDSDIAAGRYRVYGNLEEARFNQIVAINVKSQSAESVFLSYELSDNAGNFFCEFGLKDIPSGDYSVVLGAYDMSTPLELEEKIFYSNPDDIKRTLEKINYIAENEKDRDKAKKDIISELNNNKRILGINNNFYQNVSLRGFESIADRILNDAPFSPDEDGLNRFIISFYDIFVVEAISHASKDNIIEVVNEFWDKYELEKSALYPIYNGLGENKKNVLLRMTGTYADKEEIKKAFSCQTVLEKINIAEKWYDIYSLFKEYQSVFSFDFSDYKGMSTEELAAAAFGTEYKSMDDLKNRLDEKYKVSTNKKNPGGGGNGGNSSGTENLLPVPAHSAIEISKPEKQSVFFDLEDATWAKEAIEYLYDRNVISGTGDGRFEPGREITREEFVKMVLTAFDLFEEGMECGFEDVNESHWASAYIACAADKKIVSGVGENCFGTGQSITRQDMAVICKRASEYAKKSYAEVHDKTEFTDDSEISDYAKDSVYTLHKWGIINGFDDGSFLPCANTTRAQAATVIYRLTKGE